MDNIHAGHRERLKEQFVKTKGMLNDHQLLELLLFYAIPQKDTNPLAHSLLNTFGSIEQVFNAHIDDIKRVKGMGNSSAVLISLVSHLANRFITVNNASKEVITNPEQAIRYCVPLLCKERREVVCVIALSSTLEVIHTERISEGTISATPLSARSVMDVAVRHNATNIILCHNHPSGSITPSPEDELTTEYIANALKALEVEVRDHVIVAGLRGYSMFANVMIDIPGSDPDSSRQEQLRPTSSVSKMCAADYRLGARPYSSRQSMGRQFGQHYEQANIGYQEYDGVEYGAIDYQRDYQGRDRQGYDQYAYDSKKTPTAGASSTKKEAIRDKTQHTEEPTLPLD